MVQVIWFKLFNDSGLTGTQIPVPHGTRAPFVLPALFRQLAGFEFKSHFLWCQLLLIILANSHSASVKDKFSIFIHWCLKWVSPFRSMGSVIWVKFLGKKRLLLPLAKSALQPVFSWWVFIVLLALILHRTSCLWHLQFSNWLTGRMQCEFQFF